MQFHLSRSALAAIALTAGLALAGCAGQATNPTLYSVKQPVVERSNYSLDLVGGAAGIQPAEQARLDAWFEALDLGYGDRISIDDPTSNPANRDAVAAIAARYHLLLSEGAPITEGYVQPGQIRVVVTRSSASVPGCPDWTERAAYNYNNSTNAGFGCAINGNLAAMVADPEHLIKGATGTGETTIMTSTKAIESYREQAPTGEKGLTKPSTGAN